MVAAIVIACDGWLRAKVAVRHIRSLTLKRTSPMNVDRFDALSRSLSLTPSRRGALRLLAGLVFGSLVTLRAGDAAAHDALKACKKKKGKQKKKCVKKARAHNATHTAAPGGQVPACTPNCAGKNCGLDGCGGLCGSCNDGTCTDGTCLCRGGEEVCQGTCVPKCGTLQIRIPGSCTCCGGPSTACPTGSHTCCSQRCSPSGFCEGRPVGDPCQFNEQCTYENCTGSICRCPSGWMLRPDSTASCCAMNGEKYPIGSACCSGRAEGDRCVGRPDGQACDFHAQCASRFGCIDGECGGRVD